MVPISTTLPMTASTMVTALGAELHAGKEGEKKISSGAGVSRPGYRDVMTWSAATEQVASGQCEQQGLS